MSAAGGDKMDGRMHSGMGGEMSVNVGGGKFLVSRVTGNPSVSVSDVASDLAYRLFVAARKQGLKFEDVDVRDSVVDAVATRYFIEEREVTEWFNSDGNIVAIEPQVFEVIHCEATDNVHMDYVFLLRVIMDVEVAMKMLYGLEVPARGIDAFPRWYNNEVVAPVNVGPRDGVDEFAPSSTRNVRSSVKITVKMDDSVRGYKVVSEYVKDGRKIRSSGIRRKLVVKVEEKTVSRGKIRVSGMEGARVFSKSKDGVVTRVREVDGVLVPEVTVIPASVVSSVPAKKKLVVALG